jgi:hypothetical protein
MDVLVLAVPSSTGDGILVGVILFVLLAPVIPIAIFQARQRKRIADALDEPPPVDLPDVEAMLARDDALERAREHVTMVCYRQGRPPMSRHDPGLEPELFVIRKDGGSQTLRDRGHDTTLRRLGAELAEKLGVEFSEL